MSATSRIHYECRVCAVGRFYAHRFIHAPPEQRQAIECRIDAAKAALALPESQLPLILFLANCSRREKSLPNLFGSLAGVPPALSIAPAGNSFP